MSISLGSTIRQAMEVISRGGIGTVFIVDTQSRRFLGLMTDGDIRRAILKGWSLETKIELLERPQAKTAAIGMNVAEITKMFGETVRVIPILDQESKIVDIALYDQRLRLPVAEPSLAEKELAYVTDCIVSNWISSTGKYVSQFEALFADFCGSRHAVATSNGTTALHLALLALDIHQGDEVIVPSLTFIATANAVSYTGAKPVFVDSESTTWNIDPDLVAKAVTPRTKAIIPVHLYGHPADMDPILEIARRHDLAVIEDAAEAHGAGYKGKKVGSIGDIGIFSFYGNKIITTGEGGMIVTDNPDIAQRVRLLRDHGMSPSRRYWHPVLGYNYRLTNIQAAIGVAQVERIESILQAKLDIAQRYEKQLEGVAGIIRPPQAKWAQNVYWLYSILVEEEYGIGRDDLMAELNLMHIETRPFFLPVHTQPIYNTGQYLSVSQELASKGLSLPSSASLQKHEIDRVCKAIKDIHKKVENKIRVNRTS
ncbi:MAG: aminotransferase class I/II-fold pyridoxal phosphate-dependent enzyme [Candidatus Omnitrophica bacterium]|nr:aminotransferase class I/II-fold pyridoxal phosphate-dependent enzyme [Candidatus Omnitrophota bacterium]